jgi:NADPH:quinone reductase-like Zn-dependent oxidoreductase
MNLFIDNHRIKPVIDRVFDFTDAPAAYLYMEHGNHFGKVVIRHA